MTILVDFYYRLNSFFVWFFLRNVSLCPGDKNH